MTKLFWFGALSALIGGWSAQAGPITIVSDAGSPGNGQHILSPVAGETWTQTGTYSGVTIQASLVGSGDFVNALTGTAYLMSQVGPGTTTANQLATPFAISLASGLTNVTLFTGLTLGPGTYYLLINGGTLPVGWGVTSTPSFTTDAGISGIAELTLSGGQAGYAPASSFTTPTSGEQFLFTVTGTPVTGSPTPEPGTSALIATGIAALALIRRKRAA